MTGRILLVGTPIGNPLDASTRLREVLTGADLIAAEDTRKLRGLAQRLELHLTAPVIAFHEHNEHERVERLLDEVRDGKIIAVVSDAGMPTISDPGFPLVAGAVAAGLEVSVIPGPSAVLSALAMSGLPTDRFLFEGFTPRKSAARRAVFTELAGQTRTLVFFEAPHRLAECLADMAEVFGADRPAAVARELTKTYEEVKRGPLSELAQWAEEPVRGEIVVVVGGYVPQAAAAADLVPLVQELTAQGLRLKDAAAQVAQQHGGSKKELYDAVLATRID